MLYFLTIAQDGWTLGADWRYPRWALCASTDGRTPAFRYRNGGPRALTRPSASKESPQWQRRAVAYVHAAGGLPLSELETVVEWFRAHRTGTPIVHLTADADALAAK
jgi:hypothetical protein